MARIRGHRDVTPQDPWSEIIQAVVPEDRDVVPETGGTMPLVEPRPRKEVSPMVTTIGWPFLRWSRSRRAYVLRVVGKSKGPVLRPKPTARLPRDDQPQNPYGS